MMLLLAGKTQNMLMSLSAGGWGISALGEYDQSSLMCLNHHQLEQPPCSVSSALCAKRACL